jgi:hypothetical protein
MRRMPASRRLSSLVTAGVDVDGALHDVAHQLATLHARSGRSAAADHAAGVEATRARWVANTEGLLVAGEDIFDDVAVGTVNGLAMRYLDGRARLLEARVTAGRAVDGHGDLLADDIFCLPDGPRVLDCLDFDVRFRLGDGLADAAFLAMDLERLGHPYLGARFLAHYREHADDAWPPSLAHHHIAYRAQVRAKVAAVRWSQGDSASAEAAARLLTLSHEHLRRGRVRLVLVGGQPGTGKSTVARGLADPLDALVLRSDEVRKSLAGLDPLTPSAAGLDEGLYRPAMTDAAYAELLDRARTALGLGRTVVLDATWRDGRWRQEAAGVAAAASADLIELRCTAPLDVAVERVRRRSGTDASDATEAVTRALWAGAGPWSSATEIDTSGDEGDAIAEALAAARR